MIHISDAIYDACLHPRVQDAPPPRGDRAMDRFHLRGIWECDYCGNAEVKLKCESCGAPIPKKYLRRWAFASY